MPLNGNGDSYSFAREAGLSEMPFEIFTVKLDAEYGTQI
jgi:hypothetical protein